MKRIKVHPDGIIAWLPDRLARNMRDAGEIIEMLDAQHLKDLRFVMYSFHNDSSGKEHLAMEFARAKAYSDHLQDNVLRGTIPQEIKGRMTRPLPPAFSWEKNAKSADYLKIIPSKFHEHWRNVFRWKLAGKTNEDIATLLRDAGYADRKEYMTKKKTTKIIHVKIDGKYVGRHMKNPLHCGLLVTGEDSKEPRRADLNELYPQEFNGEPFPIVVTLADFKKVNPELFSDTAKKGLQQRRRSKYPLGARSQLPSATVR
jgi:DNA invertase Pin-like site-specific DNA recombinase